MSNQTPDLCPKTVLQAIEGMTLSINPDRPPGKRLLRSAPRGLMM